jgi:hypothetical protein
MLNTSFCLAYFITALEKKDLIGRGLNSVCLSVLAKYKKPNAIPNPCNIVVLSKNPAI